MYEFVISDSSYGWSWRRRKYVWKTRKGLLCIDLIKWFCLRWCMVYDSLSLYIWCSFLIICLIHIQTKKLRERPMQVCLPLMCVWYRLDLQWLFFFCFYTTGAYPPDLSFIANARHGGEVSAWWSWVMKNITVHFFYVITLEE